MQPPSEGDGGTPSSVLPDLVSPERASEPIGSLGSLAEYQLATPSFRRAAVVLLDWTLTRLDIIGLDLDGLDRCLSIIGWIGLMLVNPIGSNCLEGTAGTWLKYITEVAVSRHARACTSRLLVFRPCAIRALHVSQHASANGVYQFIFRRCSIQRFRQNHALSHQPRLF